MPESMTVGAWVCLSALMLFAVSFCFFVWALCRIAAEADATMAAEGWARGEDEPPTA